ncbi:Oligomerization domain-containing protein [Parasitella parasitica]|nr:Oligomerization domain-containing protein [Parasitella parasitica]
MFRSTKNLAIQSLKRPVFCKSIAFTSRIYAAPVFNALKGHQRQHFSSTFFVGKDKKAQDDDVEEIDPKDFPELYPETIDKDEIVAKDEQVDTDWFVDPEYAEEKQLSDKDFIPMWQRQALGDHFEDRMALQKASKELMASGKVTVETICSLLEESKLDNVKIIDVREKCDWAEYMIVASSAKGDKFLGSVAENVGSAVKKAICSSPNQLKDQPVPHIEGRNDKSGWLLIDLGRIIVHLFTPEMRERYDLEGLWKSVSNDPTQPMSIEDQDQDQDLDQQK